MADLDILWSEFKDMRRIIFLFWSYLKLPCCCLFIGVFWTFPLVDLTGWCFSPVALDLCRGMLDQCSVTQQFLAKQEALIIGPQFLGVNKLVRLVESSVASGLADIWSDSQRTSNMPCCRGEASRDVSIHVLICVQDSGFKMQKKSKILNLINYCIIPSFFTAAVGGYILVVDNYNAIKDNLEILINE